MHDETRNGLRTTDASGSAAADEEEARVMAEQLEAMLEEIRAENVRLLELAEERDRAIRAADMRRLGACLAHENEAVQRIADIEKRREGIVHYFASRFGAENLENVTASWIAERLPAAGAERVRAASSELREVIERLRRRNESSRISVQTLAAHMQGLLRAAEQSLSHAGTYGRRGVVEAGPRVVSAMDLTS